MPSSPTAGESPSGAGVGEVTGVTVAPTVVGAGVAVGAGAQATSTSNKPIIATVFSKISIRPFRKNP
ncbi:protein of unknown function [Candidatus Promineifilum breve]|uniref:Uncharacterized protein n=1 Tax=Candidatus Promineifilum breve TaxID=1806508 RepID=A0A160T4W1_9CHLR|nr:protein of unknown function [Candidatus Promineifilum breve]